MHRHEGSLIRSDRNSASEKVASGRYAADLSADPTARIRYFSACRRLDDRNTFFRVARDTGERNSGSAGVLNLYEESDDIGDLHRILEHRQRNGAVSARIVLRTLAGVPGGVAAIGRASAPDGQAATDEKEGPEDYFNRYF